MAGLVVVDCEWVMGSVERVERIWVAVVVSDAIAFAGGGGGFSWR